MMPAGGGLDPPHYDNADAAHCCVVVRGPVDGAIVSVVDGAAFSDSVEKFQRLANQLSEKMLGERNTDYLIQLS
jgi:hypothetical protein